MMPVLEAPLKPFTTQEKMCAQLKMIEKHLLTHFKESLISLEDSNHKLMNTQGYAASANTVAYLCKQWQAELSTEGICKAFVFINHQWVVKLGSNATDEAERYNSSEADEFRHLLIPTIPLGKFGCIQLKATLPTAYVTENNLEWEEFWYSNKLSKRRNSFKDWNTDVHVDNVGFVNNILYMLDFASVSVLDNSKSSYYHYTHRYTTEPTHPA